MTNSITPPPKLVQKWLDALFYEGGLGIDPHKLSTGLATRAAQWGADQELEACCKVLEVSDRNAREFLYAARRPKPPSLKEQALHAADLLFSDLETGACAAARDTIRRALEALPE
jgi:hypothetical protein